jgi:hypothetical protein
LVPTENTSADQGVLDSKQETAQQPAPHHHGVLAQMQHQRLFQQLASNSYCILCIPDVLKHQQQFLAMIRLGK